MRKAAVIFALLLALTVARDCFGEECAHRSIRVDSDPIDFKEVSQKIEAELRRQYWYYLRDADLIYQANLDTDTRLLSFYFHRNIVGTFFTITSYYSNDQKSEVNTLVRLGNGYSAGLNPGYKPASIEPFSLSLGLGDGERGNVNLNEQGELSLNGDIIGEETNDPEEDANQCKLLSDAKLRKDYWYYLNGAKLIYFEVLAAHGKNYQLLTYINVVGTFLVISSCQGDQVQVNTFVRLGKGSVNPDYSIISDPQPLELPPY